jgi:hypothetical protein
MFGDVTKPDSLLDATSKYPRRIKADSMSEAIVEIARRNGFISPYVLVQKTNDTTNGWVTIDAGITDAQFMETQARQRRFVFKTDGDTLRWHSPAWKDSKVVLCENLIYGGPDIISITIDSDFQLPVPNKATAKGHDLTNRTSIIQSVDYNDSTNNSLGGVSVNKTAQNNAATQKLLTREDIFAVVGGTRIGAADKAIAVMISKHMKAFQITVKCVGNPRLLANRLVKLSGTGSPFVDGTWLIVQARHTFATNDVYITEIQLKAPPENIVKKGPVNRVPSEIKNIPWNDEANTSTQGLQVNIVAKKLR